MKKTKTPTFTIILTIGTKVIVKYAYYFDRAKDYAATADTATIVDNWYKKIKEST